MHRQPGNHAGLDGQFENALASFNVHPFVTDLFGSLHHRQGPGFLEGALDKDPGGVSGFVSVLVAGGLEDIAFGPLPGNGRGSRDIGIYLYRLQPAQAVPGEYLDDVDPRFFHIKGKAPGSGTGAVLLLKDQFIHHVGPVLRLAGDKIRLRQIGVPLPLVDPQGIVLPRQGLPVEIQDHHLGFQLLDVPDKPLLPDAHAEGRQGLYGFDGGDPLAVRPLHGSLHQVADRRGVLPGPGIHGKHGPAVIIGHILPA